MYKSECYIININKRSEVGKVLNKLTKSYEVLFKGPQTIGYSEQLYLSKQEELPEDTNNFYVFVGTDEVSLYNGHIDIDINQYLDEFYKVTFISGYNGLLDTLDDLKDKVIISHCSNICSCMKKLNEEN